MYISTYYKFKHIFERTIKTVLLRIFPRNNAASRFDGIAVESYECNICGTIYCWVGIWKQSFVRVLIYDHLMVSL